MSSYGFRGLLWAGGATASNKVLEALVSRFSRNKQITLEGYLMSMSRIHLAHGKNIRICTSENFSPDFIENWYTYVLWRSDYEYDNEHGRDRLKIYIFFGKFLFLRSTVYCLVSN